MTNYYYGNDAIKAFGVAMSVRYGIPATWVAGGKACTDGETVYLPDLGGYLTQNQFEGVCGICLHELSHCLFGSVAHMKTFVETMEKAGHDPGLAASCYNCVVDIHDESRLEQYDQQYGVHRSTHLLMRTAQYAVHRADLNQLLWAVQSDKMVWQAQVCAMWQVRPGARNRSSPIGFTHRRAIKSLWNDLCNRGVDMPAIRALLQRARVRKRKRAIRTWKNNQEYQKLFQLSEELMEILEPHHTPDPGGGEGAGNEAGEGGEMGAVSQDRVDADCNSKVSNGNGLPNIDSGESEQGGTEQDANAGGQSAGRGTPRRYGNTKQADPETSHTIGRYVRDMIDQAAADCRDEAEYGYE